MKTNVAKNAEPSKSRKFFMHLWNETKNFFNPKEWLKTLRSIPPLALTLATLATVLMNILANKSIIELPWLIQDAGICLSWIGFLVGDIVVKAFGSKNAIRMNLTALLISLVVSVLLVGVSVIPGHWSVEFNYMNSMGEFTEISKEVGKSMNAIIGNVWYVILGSAAASAVGLICNGISQGLILNKIEKKHGDHYWGFLAASTSSTIIGQLIDNITVAMLVSVKFFGWTWKQVIVCSITGAVVELICEIIFTPLTYKIGKNWEKNKIGVKYMEASK